MDIDGIIWLEQIIDKLAAKHLVEPDEVEQILTNARSFRRIQRGDVAGEDLYATLGQTDGGRYLIVFFIYKQTSEALVISARDATARERQRYGRR